MGREVSVLFVKSLLAATEPVKVENANLMRQDNMALGEKKAKQKNCCYGHIALQSKAWNI